MRATGTPRLEPAIAGDRYALPIAVMIVPATRPCQNLMFSREKHRDSSAIPEEFWRMPASLLEPTGTRKLRRVRISQPGRIYHITAATHHRNRIFTDLFAGRVVVHSLRCESESGSCRTLCFVLMPDHLHWLMRLTEAKPLSAVVNNVKAHSARRLNQVFGRRGRVWQKGFHDHAMRKEEDVIATARYILRNPVRAGLVQTIRDYPLWYAIWV